jgi:hypothetical protein
MDQTKKKLIKKPTKVISKFKWHQNKKNGIYVATDGKIETKVGTEKFFERLLHGKISEYLIGEGYKILYNDQSKDKKNEFLLSFVNHTDIRGPIIFISNNSISIKKIKTILQETHNQHMYILKI